MTEAFRTYLLSVAAAAVLIAAAASLFPDGAVRRCIGWIGSLVLLLAVLAPVVRVDTAMVSKSLSRLQMEVETRRTGIEIGSRALTAEIIKTRCEAYIWDKAAELGLELRAEIEMEQGVGYPYPIAVRLYGSLPPDAKTQLEKLIAENLGIPAEKQEWMGD